MEARQNLLLLLLMTMLARETHGAITCTAVTTWVNTEVTCHFGLDISESKHNFNVQFYYPNLKADPESVLKCNFVRGGGLVCQNRKGVNFNRIVSDEIRITRPADKDRVGGLYVCQVAPPLGNTHIQPCNLTYKDIPTVPPTTASLHTSDEDGNDTIQTYLIINVLFTLIIFVFIFTLCGVFGFLYYKRERIKAWLTRDIMQSISRTTESEGKTGPPNDGDITENREQKEQQNQNKALSETRSMCEAFRSTIKAGRGPKQEHPEQEQQNQDKAQPEASPEQEDGRGFPFRGIEGRGPKQRARKEQRNTKDKGDPGQEANQMESASTGDPMLHRPFSREREHPEQEQQNQDKAQPEASPEQEDRRGFPFRGIEGRGPKQDARKEQRNTKDKGDPGQEANQMESASTGYPMLRGPFSRERVRRLVFGGNRDT